MPSWSETLGNFRTARESWDLLHSNDNLEAGKITHVFTWHKNEFFQFIWKQILTFKLLHFYRIQEDLCFLEDRRLALVQNISHGYDHIPSREHIFWHFTACLPVRTDIASCLCLCLCVPRDSIAKPSPACTRWLQGSSLHLGRRAPQARPVWSTTGHLYSRPPATTHWESTG